MLLPLVLRQAAVVERRNLFPERVVVTLDPITQMCHLAPIRFIGLQAELRPAERLPVMLLRGSVLRGMIG